MSVEATGSRSPSGGKLVVAAFLVTGLILAGYAWWHAYRRGHRSLRFWGDEAAWMIRYADETEIWSLQSAADEDPGTLTIDGQAFRITQQASLTHVAGLVHARHALVEDASFRWDPAPSRCRPRWDFVLVFRQAEEQTVVVFDAECDQVRLLSGQRSARLRGPLMDAYQAKSREWLGQETRQLPGDDGNSRGA